MGIATQDPVLRKRFTGQPEHVINFFFFIAEEVRELMAKLGFRTFSEMIGQVEKLDMRRAINHWKAKGIDLSRILYHAPARPGVAIYNCERQDHHLDKAMDNELIEAAQSAIQRGEPVRISRDIRNVHRTVGAMLSGEVAKRYGHAGLPEDTISISLRGNAGREFRCVPGARRHGGTDRRCQRLCRQGVVRRPGDRAPAAGGKARADGEHHRWQHRAVRCHCGRGVFPGCGGRTVCRAQLRRVGCRGGLRRPRL